MTETYRNLDFHLIERASEKFENLKEVLVQMEIDGKIESFVVEIYKHFATVQITQCCQELIEKLDHVRVKNKGQIETVLVPYMIFMLIKHFTTLELPNKFAEQLKAIEHMTNTGTMFQIFMSFDENEIGKVQSEISRVLEHFDSKMEEVEEFKEQIRAKLVDKSLME